MIQQCGNRTRQRYLAIVANVSCASIPSDRSWPCRQHDAWLPTFGGPIVCERRLSIASYWPRSSGCCCSCRTLQYRFGLSHSIPRAANTEQIPNQSANDTRARVAEREAWVDYRDERTRDHDGRLLALDMAVQLFGLLLIDECQESNGSTRSWGARWIDLELSTIHGNARTNARWYVREWVSEWVSQSSNRAIVEPRRMDGGFLGGSRVTYDRDGSSSCTVHCRGLLIDWMKSNEDMAIVEWVRVVVSMS